MHCLTSFLEDTDTFQCLYFELVSTQVIFIALAEDSMKANGYQWMIYALGNCCAECKFEDCCFGILQLVFTGRTELLALRKI